LTSPKPQVLTLGTFPDATMAELERRFGVHHFPRIGHALDGLDRATAHQIVALGSEANQGINRALLAMLPKLEVVALFGVGADLVDRTALRERNVALSNTPGLVAVEVADLAIGLMIASARQIIYADQYIREGRWPQAQIALGRSVGKKTMGVVGLGAIGRPIADRGAAFNMRVLYHGPRRKPDVPYEYVADVVDLARRSDFLMVACKGEPDTRHLVGRTVIEALGPNGTLVNVARGSVVDEPELVAALDVFENEPHVSPDLLALPNVIVQPHHGSAGLETRIAMGQLMIDNIVAWLGERKLLTPVALA
jgi:D-3-phosphoglycerate dehydrogenase